jgi:hypothetical protein
MQYSIALCQYALLRYTLIALRIYLYHIVTEGALFTDRNMMRINELSFSTSKISEITAL